MIKVLTQIKRKGYLWTTSQNLKTLKGLASDESESMTMREGKIRETYKLSLQKPIPKMIERKTSRTKLDDTDDSSITQAMLETAQECVEAMGKEVEGLHDRLVQTSQEAKAKLQQE